MRERPILFSGPMVRAILEGRKTQTRRVVQSPAKNMQRSGTTVIKHRLPGDPWYRDHVWSMRNRMGVWGDYTEAGFLSLCPYGRPGDRLWVREAWGSVECEQGAAGAFWGPDRNWFIEDNNPDEQWQRIAYAADCAPVDYGMWSLPFGGLYDGPWRPSIHMPRWASRILLEVTGVRVERLQDIGEEDARAEGVEPRTIPGGAAIYDRPASPSHRYGFALLWDSINGKRDGADWDQNPWVWVVEFRRVDAPQNGGAHG